MRPNAGLTWWQQQLFGPTPSTAPAVYLAISTDTATPAPQDTALAAELQGNGLSRALATVTYVPGTGNTPGPASVTLSATFVYTGTGPVVITKVGVFTASGPPPAGVLVMEDLLGTPQTVANPGDQVTIQGVPITF